MKAKIHRVVLSVLDLEGIGTEGVRFGLENVKHLDPNVQQVETREVDWSDDHPLNKPNADLSEFDRKFYALPEKP